MRIFPKALNPNDVPCSLAFGKKAKEKFSEEKIMRQ